MNQKIHRNLSGIPQLIVLGGLAGSIQELHMTVRLDVDTTILPRPSTRLPRLTIVQLRPAIRLPRLATVQLRLVIHLLRPATRLARLVIYLLRPATRQLRLDMHLLLLNSCPLCLPILQQLLKHS